MKLSELVSALGYEVLTRPEEDKEVISGYTSDLLSDVMGNSEEGSVFITIQAHKNSVAVASQLDFPAIILCNNRPVASDMLDAAKSEGVAILRTKDNQFTASYKVYAALKL
jgi:hypothetical protein